MGRLANMKQAKKSKKYPEGSSAGPNEFPETRWRSANVIVTIPMTTHHSRKSRKSRLRKCPSMGRQRVGDSIGKAPPVRDVRRNTREGHLAPPADYQHVVSVRIQTLRHVGGQHGGQAHRLLALLEQSEKEAASQNIQHGRDLVGDQKLGARG